ncbi:MAG: amidohydrolase [Anaerolineales bacterium]|nr:amidohydrolase [Anaerolineales bacterium]
MMKILRNAKIYTLDPARSQVSALLIDGAHILVAGSEADCLAYGDRAELEDLSGKTIIPGLTDAHLHLQLYALGLLKVNCETPEQPECLQRVAGRAQQSPPGEWILGHGWNQNLWPQGFGNATQLDQVAPNNPVYLTAKSLHAGWANHAALKAAGITALTPDPPDGQIQRDARGEPTGILFEGAISLVAEAVPAAKIEEVAAAIQVAQARLWRYGLTSVHDYDRRDCFAALQLLHTRGELGLRVLKNLPIEMLDHAVALGLRSGFGDDWLRIGGLKAFADGALGPHTAAMLQPYENEPGNRGMLLIDAEELFEAGRQATQNGLSLTIHAIGDRANHEVLNAFEQLRRYERDHRVSGPRLRHRIEHVQVLHPQDVDRLARLDVIASMQPIHATSDMLMADAYWGDRARLSYAWRSQLAAGARLAFGSDAPVESPNPFWGLHAAVTRRRMDGSPDPQGWYPEERLTRREALLAYTQGPAYAAGMEARLGQLSAGYLADLLVLEEDPFECPAEEIHQIVPLKTMVGGNWVYSAEC